MDIVLLLNNPLGGRCRLYRAYAAALTEHAGACCRELFEGLPSQPDVRAPAIIINGRWVQPSDGVILSPADLGPALDPSHAAMPRIRIMLEKILDDHEQEWNR